MAGQSCGSREPHTHPAAQTAFSGLLFKRKNEDQGPVERKGEREREYLSVGKRVRD